VPFGEWRMTARDTLSATRRRISQGLKRKVRFRCALV
jgi:hypothetical protein